MTQSTQPGRWHISLILILICSALVLSLSWWVPELGLRALWDQLDKSMFYALNGLLADSPGQQKFWAIANHRAFDGASALLLGLLYLHWCMTGPRDQLASRLGLFFFLVLFTLVFLELSKQVFDWFERSSPSNELKPVYLLSKLVEGIKAKDSSGQSFPGDHAMVLFLWTGYFFAYAGRWRGVIALIIAIAFSTPRLVSGAHWFTDNYVGGATIALVGIALLAGTPLKAASQRWFTGFGRKLVPIVVTPLRWLRLVK